MTSELTVAGWEEPGHQVVLLSGPLGGIGAACTCERWQGYIRPDRGNLPLVAADFRRHLPGVSTVPPLSVSG